MRRWCIAFVFLFLAGVQTEEQKVVNGEEPEDPRFTPTVTWLPEPFPVKDSAASSEQQMKPYTEQISGTDVTFGMVPIPGGEFLMGSPPDEAMRKPDKGPQHRVRIEPFWLGKHEVTWNEYDLLANQLDRTKRVKERREPTKWDLSADAVTCTSMAGYNANLGEPRDDRPAINMTQLAAKMYCKWLSAKTGRYYRLPTEAEWEYACRAGTTTAYSFGDDPSTLNDYGWYYDNSPDFLSKVGLKKPNPWGLYDMHGNVAEWVLDRYRTDYDARSRKETSVAPLAGPKAKYPNVVRGGSWDDDPEMLRSAARQASTPDWSMQDHQIPQSLYCHTDAIFVGFRLVRPLKLPSAETAARYDATDEDYLRYKEYDGVHYAWESSLSEESKDSTQQEGCGSRED